MRSAAAILAGLSFLFPSPAIAIPFDCDGNGIDDRVEIERDPALDCNGDRFLDVCQVKNHLLDCDRNGILDSCEPDRHAPADCNQNGIPDECDLSDLRELDCNHNGIPDSCEENDCDQNHIPDECDIAAGAPDIDGDGHIDSCGPVFTFGFEVPDRIYGQPGEVVTFDAFPTITTTNNFSSDGAQGWEFSLWATGCEVTAVSLKGVTVQTIYDEEDASGNVIEHHDPYPVDLGDPSTFTHIASRQKCPDGKSGAASAVVLRSQERMVLQPSGTFRMARLKVQAEIPTPGECRPIGLRFETTLDHCSSFEGSPLNVVTFRGASVRPREGRVDFLACPIPTFRRGDVNSDGAADISDVISGINFLYLGGATPGCLDAADVNDDGTIDLSDSIVLIADLFLPVAAPIPDPGPFYCGVDPVPDGLDCRSSPRCP
jgi:dockerin type I repeat protein